MFFESFAPKLSCPTFSTTDLLSVKNVYLHLITLTTQLNCPTSDQAKIMQRHAGNIIHHSVQTRRLTMLDKVGPRCWLRLNGA